MRYLFWLFCAVLVCIWLIGWVIIIAEHLNKEKPWNKSKTLKFIINKLNKWFCLFLTVLILNGCAKTIYVPIDSCPPMLRKATYQVMQADERRDYRIAIEKCRSEK